MNAVHGNVKRSIQCLTLVWCTLLHRDDRNKIYIVVSLLFEMNISNESCFNIFIAQFSSMVTALEIHSTLVYIRR